MSSTSEPLQPSAGWSRDSKVIALIAAAHFTSHVHLMLLPPIFGPVKEAFDVTYTQIGLAITVYNVVSAALQTPAGFLVDRIGPRAMLTGGLLLGAAALAVAALLPGYWLFIVAYAFLGIAAVWGWQGAFLAASGLAIASALLLIVAGSILPRSVRKPHASTAAPAKVGLDLLLSGPVVRNLLFFVCIAMANGGLQNYSVVALGALHDTPAAVANIGLSGFLLFSAAGVLLGGIIADRTAHHEWVAALGFACTSTMAGRPGRG